MTLSIYDQIDDQHRLESLFSEFCLNLGLSKTFSEAFEQFEGFITRIGFDSALYSYMPSIVHFNTKESLFGSSASLFWVSNDYPKAFLDVYNDRGYLNTDPIAQLIREGCRDILDWSEVQTHQQVSKQGQEVFDVAKHEYGLHFGVTIPTFSGKVGISAVSVMSHNPDSEHFEQLKQARLHHIVSASRLLNAMVTAQRFDQTIFTYPVLPKFNETQRKVIRGLLNGLSVPAIAKQIHKSSGYIENTVRDMRIKLGGLNDKQKPKMSKDLFIYFCTIMHLDDVFYEEFVKESLIKS